MQIPHLEKLFDMSLERRWSHLTDVGHVTLLHHDAVQLLRQIVAAESIFITFVSGTLLFAIFEVAIDEVLRDEVAFSYLVHQLLHILCDALALSGIAGEGDGDPHVWHGQQGVFHLYLRSIDVAMLNAQGLDE